MISVLEEDEKDLMMKRYFEGKTLDEVAQEKGMTHQAVFSREQKVLQKFVRYFRRARLN
ncbi:hypothetical protein J4402_04145 [Candidatus Pacearchaeota archaeon]|nr:hypothetical protein [Candidatus Pacearchaeota archaeon]